MGHLGESPSTIDSRKNPVNLEQNDPLYAKERSMDNLRNKVRTFYEGKFKNSSSEEDGRFNEALVFLNDVSKLKEIVSLLSKEIFNNPNDLIALIKTKTLEQNKDIGLAWVDSHIKEDILNSFRFLFLDGCEFSHILVGQDDIYYVFEKKGIVYFVSKTDGALLTSMPNYKITEQYGGEKGKEKNKNKMGVNDVLGFFSKSLDKFRHVKRFLLKSLTNYIKKDMEESGEMDERINDGIVGDGELLIIALLKVYSKNNPDVTFLNKEVWRDFFEKVFEPSTSKEKPLTDVFWVEFDKYFK